MPRLEKSGRGNRERTRSDASPAPTADAAKGTTPLAQIATIDTSKDAVPVGRPSYATDYGYTYHDYDELLPNDNRVQFMLRVVNYSIWGVHTKTVGSHTAKLKDMGYDRIQLFYDNLYGELLQKAVLRDGYRHLPDTLDNPSVLPGYLGLWTAAVINCRTIKALIDNVSWNDGTKVMRAALAGKYRRATEAWNMLQTFQIPSLNRIQALLHPPIANMPGGTVMATICNLAEYALLMGDIDVAHPAFIQRKHGDITTIDNALVNALLSEIEAAIAVLRFQDFVPAIDGNTSGGFAWSTATGRGAQADLKYVVTLIQELVYPMGLPEPGSIVIDPATFNDILYAECLYGMAEESTVGVVSDCYLKVYPSVVLADATTRGLIYRRAFSQRNNLIEGGLKEVWVGWEDEANIDDLVLFGAFATVGPDSTFPASTDQGFSGNAYLIWRRNSGWTLPIVVVDREDDGDLKLWLTDAGPQADHQWNDAFLLTGQHPEAPIGMATYSFFQPKAVPAELHRSALCSTWNLPFIR